MRQNFTITSPEFENQSSIPSKYTSDGGNINPPLEIRGVSPEAVSLVLIVDDPDAATDPDGPGSTFDHWIVFNIPSNTSLIRADSIPAGAAVGRNGVGQSTYIGPAPPNGEHRYYFKLYALNENLQLNNEASKQEVEHAMEGRIIGRTQLMGKYQRVN